MYTLIIEDKNGVIADEFSFHEGSFSIGRVEGNDIILPSSNVSRQHSRLFVRQGKCYVEDLGSSNGVIVDGQRIQGERDLGSAAQIRIGDYYLYLEFNKDSNGAQQDVVSTHIVSQDENAYKLVRVGDSFAGEIFVLSERRNTIGRTEDNAVFLNDPSVSRRHAQIDVEGVVYCLADMGSSNGTCVNGKRITGPTILRENDRVSFGNLDFVFVPNNEQVDAHAFAKNTNAPSASGGGGASKRNLGLIIGGLAFLFLMFLVLIVLGVAGYFLYQSTQSADNDKPAVVEKKEPTKEEKFEKFVSDGRAKMQSGKWSEAIESFDKALEIDSASIVAVKLRKEAIQERDAKEKFDAGQKAKGNADWEGARDLFKAVPKKTRAYDQAQQELKDIDKILAGNYKNEGIQAFNKSDYIPARESFIKSMELKCDDEVFDYIGKSERKISKRDKRRKGIKTYKKPADCK